LKTNQAASLFSEQTNSALAQTQPQSKLELLAQETGFVKDIRSGRLLQRSTPSPTW